MSAGRTRRGGYFRALGIPLLSGRLFDARDVPGGPTVVIVSEAIERRFFPNERAVGRRIKLGDSRGRNRRRRRQHPPRRADRRPARRHVFPVRTGPRTARSRCSSAPKEARPAIAAGPPRRLRVLEPRSIVLRGRERSRRSSAASVATTRLALWLLGLFSLSRAGAGRGGNLRSDVVRREAAHP